MNITLNNALLTGTYCGERFCVKMERSDRRKNERSSMCPRAATCYIFNDDTTRPNSLIFERNISLFDTNVMGSINS